MDRSSLTLERLLKIHSAALLAEGKSRRTVEWHTASVKRYADWVQEELGEDATLSALTLNNARAWAVELHEQPRYYKHPTNCAPDQRLQDDSISYYIRGLRSFASWLEREEYTDENILARLKTPKVPDKEVDILSHEEIATIMGHFDYHVENGARDLAIFSLLLDTGMRADELCRLKLSDLHLDEGYAMVFGKGKKQRPVKVGSRASKVLRFISLIGVSQRERT